MSRITDTREAILVEEAISGSRFAFEQLVEQHHAHVRAYLYRYLRNEDDADDIAQEVFLMALRNIKQYSGTVPVRAWLVAIARNQAVSYLRSTIARRRREGHEMVAVVAQHRINELTRDPFDLETDQRQLVFLRECVAELSASNQCLVDAHYFQKRSLASLAEETGKNAGALRMIMMRIRRTLGTCIEHKLQESHRHE